MELIHQKGPVSRRPKTKKAIDKLNQQKDVKEFAGWKERLKLKKSRNMTEFYEKRRGASGSSKANNH